MESEESESESNSAKSSKSLEKSVLEDDLLEPSGAGGGSEVCTLPNDDSQAYLTNDVPMTSVDNELEEKPNGQTKKYDCIMCDSVFLSLEDMKKHDEEKHVYCRFCDGFLTDEDALQKHNLKVHFKDNVVVKEEPANMIEPLKNIKEEYPLNFKIPELWDVEFEN